MAEPAPQFPCWCDGDPTCHYTTTVEFGLCAECASLGHRPLPPLPFSLAEEAADAE